LFFVTEVCFSIAGAKVELFFELPKHFRFFFEESAFISCMRFMAIYERTCRKILIFALLFCKRGSYEKN
jgi:hypothetical protein